MPVLVLWFFDSRGKMLELVWSRSEINGVLFCNEGGFSPGKNSTPVPDWVDDTVATWIEQETQLMNAVWGPAENRGALAFVHIPP